MSLETRKIIWGIDPTSELEIQLQAMRALVTLANSWQAAIEPVCIFRAEAAHPRNVEAAFGELVKKIELPGLLAPYAIECYRSGVAARSRLLAQYAAEQKARLIVVGSHARHGLARVLLGSFSESLILSSTVPTYVVSPRSVSKTERIERILFATDFSELSRKGLDATVSVAVEMSAELVIFYCRRTRPSEIEMRLAEAMAKMAVARGVRRVQLVIDSVNHPAAQAIVSYAKDSACGLISMISRSGVVRANMISSTTREVARAAFCPVWVQHAFPKLADARLF